MHNYILISFAFLVINYDYLKIYQLNGYKFKFNKLLKIVLNKLIACLIYTFLVLIFKKFLEIDFGVLLLSFVYLIVMTYRKRNKIKFTKRLIRILIVSLILNTILLSVSLYFGIFIVIGEFIIFSISNIILSPLEFIIQKIYILKTKKLLKRKNMKVIGITGSFGKTTTKYALYSILSRKYKVFITPKNYNTLMGICKVKDEIKDEEIFIVEMGARHKKDILKLCKLVNPTIAIETGITYQHLETFKTIDNIYKTKKELVDFIKDGFVIFNDLNDFTKKMMNEYSGEKYGILDFNYKDIKVFDDHQECIILYQNKEYNLKTNLFGEGALQDILLAIKCAMNLGLSIDECIKGVENIDGVSNRFSVKKLSNEITLIDDSYNANFEGAIKGIEFLKYFDGRKIIYTQGVVEGGKKQKEINYKIGEYMADKVDVAIISGVNSLYIKMGLLNNGFEERNIIFLKDFFESNKIFSKYLKKGDVLLIQNDLTDNY